MTETTKTALSTKDHHPAPSGRRIASSARQLYRPSTIIMMLLLRGSNALVIRPLSRRADIFLSSVSSRTAAPPSVPSTPRQLPRRLSIKDAAATTRLFATSGSSSHEHFDYDVVVVGGGHAGCEAAAAAARVGARVALVTQRIDTVGELSCNPSMGGIGKGHLVRELDALHGVMGDVADQAGIHFRVLNRRKGPAVRGPRAQMDRDLYKQHMREALRQPRYENLHIIQASVQDLLLEESSKHVLESMAPVAVTDSGSTGLLGSSTMSDQQIRLLQQAATQRQARIRGVQVKDDNDRTYDISARAVVITTGTFLRGVLMLGHDRVAGGRHLRDSEAVEPPSLGLAQTLARFDFALGRLKTGTPARVDGNTIDWNVLVKQPSEVPAVPFSHVRQFRGEQPPNVARGDLIDCYQTCTNDATHQLVLEYEHTLPRYDGLDGQGNGPRYCPSIYKKVQRFPDRATHNCFLEPEGLHTNLVYPNGMSGPYPADIQQKILRTMKGLGAVEIVRPGYDVEYDFVNPQSLTHTLETKKIGGLYLAGQICGTTGYEEAAAQGMVAGANAGRGAAAAARGEAIPAPFVLGRDEAYIGVLIDDLVTRGTLEPYRMFTSRSEYRIQLRMDNADLRLTRKGAAFGLVQDEERLAALTAREFMIGDRIDRLKHFSLKVTDWSARGGDAMGGAQTERKAGQRKTAEEVLMMPHVTLSDVDRIMVTVQKEEEGESEGGSVDLTPVSVHDTVEAEVKYQSYVQRQHKDMESWRKAQGQRIPPDITYDNASLPTLSNEELEKLSFVRPATFAEAAQISGMTPQSLVYLYHHVQRRHRTREGRVSHKKDTSVKRGQGDGERASPELRKKSVA